MKMMNREVKPVMSDKPPCKPLNRERVWPPRYVIDVLRPAYESYRGEVAGKKFNAQMLEDWAASHVKIKLPQCAFTKKPSKTKAYRESQGKAPANGRSVTRLRQKTQRYLRAQRVAGTVIQLGGGWYKFLLSRGYNSEGVSSIV